MPSSVIRAMRYEPLRRVLEIVFRGGRGTYQYFDVPIEEWRRFRDAPSKGTYLNEMFKAKGFRYEKVIAGVDRKRDRSSEDDRAGLDSIHVQMWPEPLDSRLKGIGSGGGAGLLAGPSTVFFAKGRERLRSG